MGHSIIATSADAIYSPEMVTSSPGDTPGSWLIEFTTEVTTGGGGGVNSKTMLRLPLAGGAGTVGMNLTIALSVTGQNSPKDSGELGSIPPSTVNDIVAGVTPLLGLAVKVKPAFGV